MTRIIAILGIGFGLFLWGGEDLLGQFQSWQRARGGEPGVAHLTDCHRKSTRRNRYYRCQLESDSKQVREIDLKTHLMERFTGKPIAIRVLPDGSFEVSEYAIVAEKFSESILVFGLGLSFLLSLTSAHFRERMIQKLTPKDLAARSTPESRRELWPAGIVFVTCALLFAYATQSSMARMVTLGLMALVFFELYRQAQKRKANAPLPPLRR